MTPSPFPGMDPYLQSRWSDVHAKLIAYIGEALQPMLPAGLKARSEERVLLETLESEPLRRYRADVALVYSDRRQKPEPDAGTIATVEPVIVEFSDEPIIDRFVQIIDSTNGNRVITAIEVLSPWNKSAGRLNEDYRRKINDYARAAVSLVEIDLLLGSRARLMVTEADLPAERRAPYAACIHRGWLGPRWEVYPIGLRQSVPPIPVPLREADEDAVLSLQPLLERVYVAGGHDDIDYGKPCVPPLEGEDAKWVDELLRVRR
ncbi:MAG TPA: DUF4058 family protein [Tepidisphaeraceae bacterium]|nr:DUF4058 family protein [Tepidisphaeraceae bacterium]